MATRPLNHGPYSLKQTQVKKIYNSLRGKQRSIQFYMGRICFFFVENNKYNNDTNKDGFIFGLTNPACERVPRNVKLPLIASIFFREKGNKEYTYLGDVNNIARFDNERNIMLWG